ncbi:putative feruloyl esterase B-2 [Colletotrichum spinosum]|uniref:Carboxylic ester hydrolase n=1 Tax=Colletotrichum spinosum TaxID=1347390 RepID=A0A4R8PMS8_9PEZI|nr:putative feruloyl esterase B-2 [Colletotrichum spinosum]
MVSLNFILLSLAVYTSAVRSSPVDGPSVVASGGRDGGRDGGRNGRDGDRDRDRVRVDVYMCIDKNFSGDCTTDKIYTGGCYDAPEDFRGRISAIRNDDRRDTECTWYKQPFTLNRSSTAQVATSSRSGFKLEAWLPQNWTGRFLSTGNGGLGGCVQYEDLDYASSLGFATVATNNGHDGMSGASFLNNPDVIEDFAYRALHTGCLTHTQVETLRAIYEPLVDAAGDLVYPRLQPGAELTGAPQTYFTGRPFGAADWFKYAIFNDSGWDPLTLEPADYVLSSALNLFNIETFDGDLSAFRARGGKILHYHGLADGTISSENSPRYYEHVSRTMGAGPAALDEFYRFFRISGMAHCGGGPGAAFIGNRAQSVADLDPENNVLMAVVRWVEEGAAPEFVRGTAYVGGSGEAGVDFTRRHCRWPRRNVFRGGNYKDENAWACVE